MYKASFIILSLTLASCSAEIEANCTADGGRGICIRYQDCAHVAAIMKPGMRRDQIEYVKSLKCGAPNELKVCCKKCYTPNGEIGVCRPLHQCDYLVDRLVKKDLNYVINSQCPSGAFQFCCGPPPNINVRAAAAAQGDCAAQMTAFPPDPASTCCGLDASAKNKIVGGVSASIDDYPWLALLEYQEGNMVHVVCGGTLISGKYVVTAAHCVYGHRKDNMKSVRLGEYDLENEGRDFESVASGVLDYTDGAVSIPVEEIILHPEYDKTNHLNDIALIRLQHSANYTDFIRPICLPATDISLERDFTSMKSKAAGWGAVNNTKSYSRYKQHVELPFVDLEECRRRYKQKIASPVSILDSHICAGGAGGRDSCKGDSGGPLMSTAPRGVGGMAVFELTGVINYGSMYCGQPGVPAVNAKVSHYNVWIRSQIRP